MTRETSFKQPDEDFTLVQTIQTGQTEGGVDDITNTERDATPSIATNRRQRVMSRAATSLYDQLDVPAAGAGDGTMSSTESVVFQTLLAQRGHWDQRFQNDLVEGEFAIFFNRSRIPCQVFILIQCAVILGVLASGGFRYFTTPLLTIIALFIAACALGAYRYLSIERARLNQLSGYRSPRKATSVAAFAGSKAPALGVVPDAWFRADTLLATDDNRKALRRNANLHELVIFVHSVAYCVTYTGVLITRNMCSEILDPQAAQVCKHTIFFEATFVMFVFCSNIVAPQRFHIYLPIAVTQLAYCLAIPWAPFVPNHPTTQYVACCIVFTIVTALSITAVVVLERQKRKAFGEVMWNCIIAERSEILRHHVSRLAKTAYPFDVDAFLWDGPATTGLTANNNNNTTANMMVVPAAQSTVFAQAANAVALSVRLFDYVGWSRALSPKELVWTLKALFRTYEELISSTTRTNGISSSSESSLFPADNDSPSIDGRETNSPSVNASSKRRSLMLLPSEQMFRWTCGDAFLLTIFPSTSSSLDTTLLRAPNPMTPQLRPVDSGTDVQSLLARVIAYGTSCTGVASTTLGVRVYDGAVHTTSLTVYATVASGAASAAATGNVNGVHVHVIGQPIIDVMRSSSNQNTPPPATQQGGGGGMGMNGGEEHVPSMSIVVHDGSDVVVVQRAINEIRGTNHSEVHFTVPYPLPGWADGPDGEEDGCEELTIVGSIVYSGREWSNIASGSTSPPQAVLYRRKPAKAMRGALDVAATVDQTPPRQVTPSNYELDEQLLDATAVRRTPPTCLTTMMARALRVVYLVVYRPFQDEEVELAYLTDSRTFNRQRLLFVSGCGIIFAVSLLIIEILSAVVDDIVSYDDVMKASFTDNGLLWFALCIMWALLALIINAMVGASATYITYNVFFALYAACYCTGIFTSATGTVVNNSTLMWMHLLVTMSVARPQWEHFAFAALTDVALIIVFLVRVALPSQHAPARIYRAMFVQVACALLQYFAVRCIHERMRRSFFVTRLESAEYTHQIEQHVASVDRMLRTIAPDVRVAEELSVALRRRVQALRTEKINQQQERITGKQEQPGATDDMIVAALIHDTQLLFLRFTAESHSGRDFITSPTTSMQGGNNALHRGTSSDHIRAFHESKRVLHSALQQFFAALKENDGDTDAAKTRNITADESQADGMPQPATAPSPAAAPPPSKQSFFVLDHVGTLGATIVSSSSSHITRCLRSMQAAMSTSAHPVCTAVAASGPHVGAIVGLGAIDLDLGSAQFDVYGNAIVVHRTLLDRLEPGSTLATSRFLTHQAQEQRNNSSTHCASSQEPATDYHHPALLVATSACMPFQLECIRVHGSFVQ